MLPLIGTKGLIASIDLNRGRRSPASVDLRLKVRSLFALSLIRANPPQVRWSAGKSVLHVGAPESANSQCRCNKSIGTKWSHEIFFRNVPLIQKGEKSYKGERTNNLMMINSTLLARLLYGPQLCASIRTKP